MVAPKPANCVANRRKCRMSYTAQQCFDKARDRQAIAAFTELARQWQKLARQKEGMERDSLKLPQSK